MPVVAEALPKEVIAKSVTKADHDTGRFGVFNFMLPQSYGKSIAHLPDLPLPSVNGKQADIILSTAQYNEGLWANAINVFKDKIASIGWDIKGDAPRWVKSTYEILHNSDFGAGWIPLIQKCSDDFLATDAGTFIEVIRATSSPKSALIGLAHLDSLRCHLTGNPNKPVMYMDLMGVMHELEYHQVIHIADNVSPRAELLGTGFCSARRAYDAIRYMHRINLYNREMLSGTSPLKLHLISGIAPSAIESALESARTQAAMKGVYAYGGQLVIPYLDDGTPRIATLKLVEPPESFVWTDVIRETIDLFANATGLSRDDLRDKTGQALGVGTQSEIQYRKEASKKPEVFKNRIIHELSKIIPAKVTFGFTDRDIETAQAEANRQKTEIDKAVEVVKAQILPSALALNDLVDKNVFPKKFLPSDLTENVTMSDSDNSDELDNSGDNALGEKLEAMQATDAGVAITQQPASSNNVLDLSGDESEEDDMAVSTKAGGAGSRGGEYWLDDNGEIRYDDPPQGVKRLTPQQHARNQKKQVTQELDGVTTQQQLKSKGWEIKAPLTRDKAKLLQTANQLGQANPKSMFVVKKVGKYYTLITKPKKSLQKLNTPTGNNADNVVVKEVDYGVLVDSVLPNAQRLYQNLASNQATSLKHLTGKHDQSNHGRRHLSGLSGLIKNGLSRVEAKTKLANEILADKDSPADRRRAALRALPKADRVAHYKKPVAKSKPNKSTAIAKDDPRLARVNEIDKRLDEIRVIRKPLMDEYIKSKEPLNGKKRTGRSTQALFELISPLDFERDSLIREKTPIVQELLREADEFVPRGEKYSPAERSYLDQRERAQNNLDTLYKRSVVETDDPLVPGNPQNQIWKIITKLKDRQEKDAEEPSFQRVEGRVRQKVHKQVIDKILKHAQPYKPQPAPAGYVPTEEQRSEAISIISRLNNLIDNSNYPETLADKYTVDEIYRIGISLANFGRPVIFPKTNSKGKPQT